MPLRGQKTNDATYAARMLWIRRIQKKKMWSDKRVTNLIKLLNVSELIVKASKFLFDTNELLQYRHFNEVQIESNDDDDVIFVSEALKKDEW